MSYYTSKALSNLGNSLADASTRISTSIYQADLNKQKAQEAAIASQQNRINEFMKDLTYNENSGFVYNMFSDGKTDNIDEKVNQFWNQDSLIENMVSNIGVSEEACLKWFEDNGHNFKYYLDQNVNTMTTDYNKAITLANFENDSKYLSADTSLSYDSMLDAEREFYVPVKEGGADPTGEKNPDMPNNRHNSGLELLMNKMVNSATDAVKFGEGFMTEDEFVAHFESEYDNLIEFANAGYETDAWKSSGMHTYDENYISNMSIDTKNKIKSAASEAYVTAYSEQSKKINNQVVDIIASLKLDVGEGEMFDTGYFESQVRNAGLDTNDPMVKRSMADYDPSFRASMLSRAEAEKDSERTEYKSKLGEEYTNFLYESTRKKEQPTEEGFRKWLDDKGVDSSDNDDTNDYYLKLATLDWERENAIQEEKEAFESNLIQQQQEAKKSEASFVVGQAYSQIKTALGKGSMQPKFLTVSSDGTSTEKNDGSVLEISTDSMLVSILDDTVDLSVQTYYGEAVEQIAKTYGIKDNDTLMYIASELNDRFTLDSFKSNEYGELYSEIMNPMTYPNDEEISNNIMTAYMRGAITEENMQDLLKALSSRKNPITEKVQTVEQMINDELYISIGRNSDKINQVKVDIGFNSTLSETLGKWLQANPTASNEEMRDYAKSIVKDYSNNEFSKSVMDELNRLSSPYTRRKEIIFHTKDKDAIEAYNDYLTYGDYFISDNPDAYKQLSLALKGGTKGTEFENKKELLEFATKAFFGPNEEYKNLSESNKANVLEAIGISMIELSQYRNIEKVAYATEPEGYNGPDWCTEVRLSDGRVGILNRNGLLFSSNGSDGACKLSIVDTRSDEYKDAFSENPLGLKFSQPILDGYSCNYKPTIFKEGKLINYKDLSIETLRDDIEFRINTGYYGTESMLGRWGYDQR